MNKDKITSENFEQEKHEENSNKLIDKKTKDKSNAQKAMPILIVVIISLVVILTCVLIAYYQVYSSNKQNSNVLEGVYASSYYSMVDNVNNLAVDISKYSTLSTTQAKINTIQDIKTDCNYIVAGLGVLPIEKETAVSAIKFFNQINGMCEAYAKTLSKGNSLTQEQEIMFDKIGMVVAEIKENFNKQSYGMYDTGFNFVDAGIFDDTGMNELSVGMGDITGDSIEYPSMIFDGPFSTALETKQVKGLPEEESSQEQAYSYLKDVVHKGVDAKIEYVGDTNGDIATYNYQVEINQKKYYEQVSKRGTLLITVSSYAESGDVAMKIEEAVKKAENFANAIKFDSMKAVWKEIDGSVAYINLAPVKDDIIFYPDLVKVKIDLVSGSVIGFEAVNYALNHTEREIEFNLSNKECETVLGFDYNVLKVSKAVIRLDSGVEKACFEYVAERIDGDYFYYIDANNKEILKVMKLVTVKDVEKLI